VSKEKGVKHSNVLALVIPTPLSMMESVLFGLVGDDADEELRLRVQLALVREALEPDLVQRLRGSQRVKSAQERRSAEAAGQRIWLGRCENLA
jgi:hypothetical protein